MMLRLGQAETQQSSGRMCRAPTSSRTSRWPMSESVADTLVGRAPLSQSVAFEVRTSVLWYQDTGHLQP